MPRAVQFDHYGEVDVLDVREVSRPTPGVGDALIRVRAAGINPGEASIREGRFREQWPSTFPSGQGSDLAGTIEELGDGVEGWAVGDEVLGWTDRRGSQAELVAVEASHLVTRPAGVPWEVAGSLFVVGTTAYACVRAVGLGQDDTVAISAAAGGVGSLAVQLARLSGARVVGLASEGHHEWLRGRGVIPVAYGDGLRERIEDATSGGLDAFIDTFGSGYVDLALELGVAPQRINTIIDFGAVERHGVKAEGSATAARPEVLEELAGLIDSGRLEVPIARIYPLEAVREAYRELAHRHTRGKIVLVP